MAAGSTKPSEKTIFPEAHVCDIEVVDTSQWLRDICIRAAAEVCAKIEGVIATYSLKMIIAGRNELDMLTNELSKYGVDPSTIKNKLERLMTSATLYDSARLACAHKCAMGTSAQKLAETESEITTAQEIRQTSFDQRQSTLESLENLKKEQQKLEQTLDSLDADIFLHDARLADLEQKKCQIREIPELTVTEIEEAKKLRANFEEHRSSFKGLTWM
ncbi:uncharacterized protein LOC126805067 [Argentina anserina]|uniref:uncharacterized protein LOC126805067 n=1 Tax=Argentina anserina TaxID=57926 RepID=UPI002176262A|nr:uncharacterized protein LOC126805067 [Potentilla anserina]